MKLLIRKLRDHMVGLRSWLVPRIQDLLAVKKSLSQLLRRQPFFRWALNLPSPTTLSVQEWVDREHGTDERCLLDPEQKVDRKIPLTNEPRNNWFYEASQATQIDATSVLKLQEGFVHGHSGAQLLTRQGNYLWDANTEDWLYFKHGFYMDSVLHLPRATRLKGNVAVLSHRDARNNFSHWVFDVLPRIGLLERTVGLKSIDHFLVCHSGKRYEWETLEQLGIAREKVIQLSPHSYFQATNIIFPSISRYYNASHQPSTLEFLKKSFLPANAGTRKRRLFISRADASFRRLIGEEELCRRLASHGFEVITLAGVSLSDTAALFSSAEMIIGPFGSGLMNICFCPPGCVIVDIAPPEFYNAHHWYLSEESGLAYACYFGNGGLIDPHRPLVSVTKDIHIDVDDCHLFIKRMIERLG
jgi:capsular polysaccharide biosynthesis protein